MKKLFLLLLTLLPVSVSAATTSDDLSSAFIGNAVRVGTPRQFDFPYCKGMVTNYQSSNLSDDYCVKVENMYSDKDVGNTKRSGYVRDNTAIITSAPINGLWDYVSNNGTEYLVGVSSNILFYTVGGSTYTTISSTLTLAVDYDAIAAFGSLYVVNASTAFSWPGNGLIVSLSTGFPTGRYIEKFRNRIAIAGMNGARSELRLSAHLDPTDWVLGGDPTDAVSFIIGANDGDYITGLYAFEQGLIITKRRSIYILTGDDNENFKLRPLSLTIGCIQDRSLRAKQGKLYWLSHRGLERFELATFLTSDSLSYGTDIPMYEPIKDITDKIVQGYDVMSENSLADGSQSDFAAGTSSHTDTGRVPGAVVLSSPTYESTYSTWTYLLPTFYYQSIYPLVNSTLLSVAFQIYEHGCQAANTLHVIVAADNAGAPGTTLRDQVITGCSFSPFSGTAWRDALMTGPIPLTGQTTYWVGLKADNPGTQEIVVSSNTYPNLFTYHDGGLFPEEAVFRAQISSASFTSRALDLGPSVSRFGKFDADYTLNEGNIIWYTRSAATQGGLDGASWFFQTIGATVAAPANRFVEYRADFSINSSSNVPAVLGVNVSWIDSTNKQSVASWVVDDRYYLSHTTMTTSGATDDAVLVVDRSDNFQMFRNITAASFVEAFGGWYFGSSISSGTRGGNIYLFNNAYSDDGVAINSFIETKDFCQGDCYITKWFNALYIRTLNTGSGGGTLVVRGQFDKSGLDFSMGNISLIEASGLITAKVPFSFGTGGSQGKTIRFKFSNSEVGQDFRFYGGRLYYEPLPLE